SVSRLTGRLPTSPPCPCPTLFRSKVRYKIQGGATALDMFTADPETVTRGTLTLYFFDRASQAQVWSAWTSKDLAPGSDPDAVIKDRKSTRLNSSHVKISYAVLFLK